LADYLALLRFQDAIYPSNYVKMRCVENHDQIRVRRRIPDRAKALAWTAFQAFNKGAFLIYGGQESENSHTPSLFDVDKVQWGDYSLQSFLTRLARLKKHPAQARGLFSLLAAEPVLAACWQAGNSGLYGLFNVTGASGDMTVHLPAGRYDDLLNDQVVEVDGGRLAIPQSAAILRYDGVINQYPVYSVLLDYHWSPPAESAPLA
jgi:hypothetical protein